MRVGIIGHGTLGGAIAAGLGVCEGVRAIESTTRATSARNAHVVAASDVVLLCVKPKDIEDAVRSIEPALAPHHVLISTVATIGSDAIRTWSGNRAAVVRVMPNTPAQTNSAMTVIGRSTTSEERAIDAAHMLFSSIGRAIVMDESLLDASTAVSGCGPAFLFVVMEAMIDGAIALGIPYAQARGMAAQTMLGSAALLLAGDAHPAQLKTAVATPAGRTVRGLVELEEGRLRATLIRAVLAAAGALPAAS